jgi:homoserine kinase
MRTHARAFAPACVGNVAVGFDVLGHTIEGAGDTVTVRRIAEPVVRIAAIRGVVTDLPRDPALNTAGAALIALREGLGLPWGFELEIDKGIPLGSGMAGSAASCVAALVAANALLDAPLSREALYPFAQSGESLASGSRNGDNVGPMLLGGLVLATARRLVSIPVPMQWHCALVHPRVVLETLRARAVLDAPFPLDAVVRQGGNLGLVLAGCFKGDAALVREGLRDEIVEPRRAALVAGFPAVQAAARAAGAMGASLSGAGPSVFAWFDGVDDAVSGAAAMAAAFADAGFASDQWISPVSGPAARLLD